MVRIIPTKNRKNIERIKTTIQEISSLSEIAQKIYEGKIIGWFSGRMEFGPRSLGGRSILANPAFPGIKDKINNFVKHRESWRPFAPSVLKEHAADYFENYYPSPFMLLTFKTRPDKEKNIQAAIHFDKTARVQEVSRETNPRYYELIEEFHKISGIPVLLNTSLNDRGEPICLTLKMRSGHFIPRDWTHLFWKILFWKNERGDKAYNFDHPACL